jgi:hypothetical protein
MMHVAGEVVQAHVGAETSRFHRRIEAPIGGSVLSIIDIVTNDSRWSPSNDLPYRINFGCAGIADGSCVELDGRLFFGSTKLAEIGAGPRCVSCANSNSNAHCIFRTPPAGGGELRVDALSDTARCCLCDY